jgi:DNA invertase Pin-like site-specific DNA recombinase
MNQKAIGYIRVSTTDQALEGVSLEAQRSRIDAWCLANGFDLVCVHEDAGISGGRADNRPGLQQAIEDACSHKAAVVVYSLSRLGRSMRDVLDITARLDKCGADLVSLSEKIDTTSAAGRMLFHILAALAQFERDLTAERTLAAMAHMRQNNRRISGRIPFGYNLAADGVSLVVNAQEESVINEMVKLRSGGCTLQAIANQLNARGVTSKTGGKWVPKTVRGVLLRWDAVSAQA